MAIKPDLRNLSDPMKAVLWAMANGFELASGGSVGYWLQYGGAGKGGPATHGRPAGENTVHALNLRGLIEFHGSRYPTQLLRLTPLGKKLAADLDWEIWRPEIEKALGSHALANYRRLTGQA